MTLDDKIAKIKMEDDPHKAFSEAMKLIIQLLQILTESDNTDVV